MVCLIAGCTNGHSDVPTKADKIIVPPIKQYTAQQYDRAAVEHDRFCMPDKNGAIAAPMLCQLIDDFGRMRDAARVALGLKVDVNR